MINTQKHEQILTKINRRLIKESLINKQRHRQSQKRAKTHQLQPKNRDIRNRYHIGSSPIDNWPDHIHRTQKNKLEIKRAQPTNHTPARLPAINKPHTSCHQFLSPCKLLNISSKVKISKPAV